MTSLKEILEHRAYLNDQLLSHSDLNRPVLDGHVRLVDWLGNDLRPVGGARCSFAAAVTGSEKDWKLLKRIAKDGHLTPFEHVVLTWEIRAPRAICDQFRTYRWSSQSHFSYRWGKPEKFGFYTPADIADQTRDLYYESYDKALESYHKLVKDGVPREQARFVLPQGQYSQFWMTINFRNLVHLLEERMDEHAQWEIQQYANAMRELTAVVVPALADLLTPSIEESS